MIRLLIVILTCCLTAVSGRAEDILMKDVFRQVPDSLFPYLSETNRLDFIDFLDSGMKAEVRNELGDTSEMTALTADSLSIRMSEALRVDMLLLKPEGAADSCRIVCLVETFGTDSLSRQSIASFYTLHWQPIAGVPPLSEADKKRLEAIKLQTILKWDDEILKKN